jgi:hypothetical protein
MNEFRERRQESAVQIQAKRPGGAGGTAKGRCQSCARTFDPQIPESTTLADHHALSPAPNSFVFALFEVNVPPVFSPFQRNSGENLIDLR